MNIPLYCIHFLSVIDNIIKKFNNPPTYTSTTAISIVIKYMDGIISKGVNTNHHEHEIYLVHFNIASIIVRNNVNEPNLTLIFISYPP